MARISIPTTARLPDSVRVESTHPVVVKLLSRLSRTSLIDLAVAWLNEDDLSLTEPYLRQVGEEDADEDDDADLGDFYLASRSLDELREVYAELQAGKGSRREVVDRILEGDWRHGLTLYQLAMADLQYLHDNPRVQKWSAYRIAPLKLRTAGDHGEEGDEDVSEETDRASLLVPRFHPSTFLRNLQALLPPDIKAHSALDRHKELPILLLRIFVFDSPYNTSLAASGDDQRNSNQDASRTIFIGFPDASPHVFISGALAVIPGNGGRAEALGLRSMIVGAIPKALSRPGERYALHSTSLTAKNMAEMVHRRGGGRTNGAGGGWGIYADQRKKESPLDTMLPTPPLSSNGSSDDEEGRDKDKTAGKRTLRDEVVVTFEQERDQRAAKRRKQVAQARFGDSARVDDGLGIERLDVVMQDPFPAAESRLASEEDGVDAPAAPDQAIAGHEGRRTTLDLAFRREAELREEQGDDDSLRGSAAGSGRREERPQWRPGVKLTFHGTHVFAGIRQLVELGVFNGERIPGWMTGEEGVTIGAVRDGRIRGHKGSGL